MSSKVFEFFILVHFGIFRLSYGSMENFHLNIDDILNERLMPAFLLWQPDIVHDVNNTISVQAEGDFGKAYSMMGYHRRMMNEYLCSSFIANQIMSELKPNVTPVISRRQGTPAAETVTEIDSVNATGISRQSKMIPNEELLHDPGSSGYKNWLSKTTTLDDIQRQFASNHIGPGLNQPTKKGQDLNRRQSYSVDEATDEDYEEGDVTGYAVQQPIHVQPPLQIPNYVPDMLPAKSNYPDISSQFSHPYPTAGSKNGYYPTGHDTYDESYGVQSYEHSGQTKDLGLKDIMEIALTTLAFLSFGMFLLQVLMCITMNKSDNNLMMMPMEVPEGGGSEEVEEIRRSKRSPMGDRMQKINEISRRVLLSIDTALYAYEDEGQCLYRALCDNNSFAKIQTDSQKIWIPVWSLGLSWLSARMVPPKTSTTAILNSLKAAALGLGGAKCDTIYSTCDFRNLEKKKTRERRETKTFFEWSL